MEEETRPTDTEEITMDNTAEQIANQNIAESITTQENVNTVQPKQEIHPNLNAGNPGKWAMKWKTPEERQKACADYCVYLEKGLPKEYYGPASPETIRAYIEQYPEDFNTEKIYESERIGKQHLIEIGYAAMLGKVKGFVPRTWEFVTQNMTHFKLRNDVTTNDGPISVSFHDSLKQEEEQE